MPSRGGVFSDDDLVIDPVILPGGGYRVGSVDGPIDMRALVGYCIFQSDDATLLSSLLPELVVVRGEHRLVAGALCARHACSLARRGAEEFEGSIA